MKMLASNSTARLGRPSLESFLLAHTLGRHSHVAAGVGESEELEKSRFVWCFCVNIEGLGGLLFCGQKTEIAA